MFISKWWGEYFGGTDDGMVLTDYFAKGETAQYTLAGILSDFNVSTQESFDGFRSTDNKDIRYIIEDKFHADIDLAINLLLYLAIITLESLKSGSVPLAALTDCDSHNKQFAISVDKDTLGYLVNILKDFCENHLEYDLAEMCDEETMSEIASQCKEVVSELEKEL